LTAQEGVGAAGGAALAQDADKGTRDFIHFIPILAKSNVTRATVVFTIKQLFAVSLEKCDRSLVFEYAETSGRNNNL